jgi:hypothetical protein
MAVKGHAFIWPHSKSWRRNKGLVATYLLSAERQSALAGGTWAKGSEMLDLGRTLSLHLTPEVALNNWKSRDIRFASFRRRKPPPVIIVLILAHQGCNAAAFVCPNSISPCWRGRGSCNDRASASPMLAAHTSVHSSHRRSGLSQKYLPCFYFYFTTQVLPRYILSELLCLTQPSPLQISSRPTLVVSLPLTTHGLDARSLLSLPFTF